MRTPTVLSLAIALLALSGVFWLIERRRPALPQQRRRARVVQVLPLYWLGFNAGALAAIVPFLTFYALLLHANVNWSYGRLRYVVASPVFHRWHHTSEEEGLDTNFAGLFPVIDLAFGTFYMPAGRQPQRFGVTDHAVPQGLVAQLLHPFRRQARASIR